MTYEVELREALLRAARKAPVCRVFEGCPICDARRRADEEARERTP